MASEYVFASHPGSLLSQKYFNADTPLDSIIGKVLAFLPDVFIACATRSEVLCSEIDSKTKLNQPK